MHEVRPPAVAGMFYPQSATELRAAISAYLDAATASGPAPKAIIAPHAGYIYSGPIAANAYAMLAPKRELIEKVVLLGPAHRVAFRGLAAPSCSHFATPLGEIDIDRASIERVAHLPQVKVLDEPHALEHSLEVQLPFLQTVLVRFELTPFVVGDASAEDVAEVLEILWGGPETLIVVSSDLSHYHDYDTAVTLDRETSRAIAALRPAELDYDRACGRTAIAGLLYVAKQLGLRVEVLDVRNSGDTAGSRDRVVGYGAYAFI
jgi:AmmeMemoRadiSam system protein B